MKRSKVAAQRILDSYCLSVPAEMDLETVLYGRGLVLRVREMQGSQGQLIRYRSKGLVCISKSIINTGQKRFVMAHELGHWEMHQDLIPNVSIDTEADFLAWHSSDTPHEREANEFAAELLMPENLFNEACIGKEFSAILINELSRKFLTSLSATALRYANLGLLPIMVILSRDGVVKWKYKSSDFRFDFFEKRQKAPANTQTWAFYRKQKIEQEPRPILASTWYPHDFKVREDHYLYEHIIPFESINGCLTFLWEHEENHNSDKDEEDFSESRGKYW